MLLDVDTVAAEEVKVSMEEVAEEDVQEEVYKVEENTDDEVVEEAGAHMKMKFTPHMSPVTLNIQSGTHYKKYKEKDHRGPGTQKFPVK